MTSGLIFDVKRYAINDGPGIRLTVFLKGCPLACDWCHNPEGISATPQKMFSAARCASCQRCVETCTQHACALTAEGIVTDPELCVLCGECVEGCPTQATEISGRTLSVADLMAMIEREVIFFDQSGGGVTASGGEPLMQPEFLVDLLDACGRRDIHRTVDTTGFAPTEVLLKVAERTDHFLFDLKMMDPERHRRHTGVGNQRILNNLEALAATGASINVRIPLIAGINDDADNIERSAAFVAALPGERKQVNLLPYHDTAAMKYQRLGQPHHPDGMSEPDPAELTRAAAAFEARGLVAVIGG